MSLENPMLSGWTFKQLLIARDSLASKKGTKTYAKIRARREIESEMQKIVLEKQIERAEGSLCQILTEKYKDDNGIEKFHLGTINEYIKDVEYKGEKVDIVLVTLHFDGSQKRYIYPKEVELIL